MADKTIKRWITVSGKRVPIYEHREYLKTRNDQDSFDEFDEEVLNDAELAREEKQNNPREKKLTSVKDLEKLYNRGLKNIHSTDRDMAEQILSANTDREDLTEKEKTKIQNWLKDLRSGK